MSPEVLAAIVSTLGLISVAVINAIVLVKLGSVKDDVSSVKTDVTKIEVATNSMKQRLEDLARAEGVQEGRTQKEAEMTGVKVAQP